MCLIKDTSMKDNPYITLSKFILSNEMTENFDLAKVESDRFGEEQRFHLYLDEKDIKSDGTPDAITNEVPANTQPSCSIF